MAPQQTLIAWPQRAVASRLLADAEASLGRDPRRTRECLRRLAARHTAFAVEVRDPREDALPDAGAIAVVDPESGEVRHLDTSSPALRRRFAAAERQRRDRLTAALGRARVQHVELRTDEDWLRDLGRELR